MTVVDPATVALVLNRFELEMDRLHYATDAHTWSLARRRATDALCRIEPPLPTVPLTVFRLHWHSGEDPMDFIVLDTDREERYQQVGSSTRYTERGITGIDSVELLSIPVPQGDR